MKTRKELSDDKLYTINRYVTPLANGDTIGQPLFSYKKIGIGRRPPPPSTLPGICLLYTSDAADE